MLNEALYPAALRQRLVASWAHARRGRPAACLRDAETVWRDAEAASDARGAASALQQMAWASFQLGEVESGLTHARNAHVLWAQDGCHSGIVWTEAMHAWLLLECGMSELASEKAVQAFVAAREADETTRCFATNVLGVVLWYCKHLDRAKGLCLDAVAEARRLGDRVVLGWWLINLAGVQADLAARSDAEGDHAAAVRLSAEALAVNEEAIGLAALEEDAWGLQIALCNSAEYLMNAGREDEAFALVARCEAMPDPIGSRSLSQFFYTKTQVLIHFGRLDEALDICEAALHLSERGRQTDAMAYALRYLSDIHEKAGRFETALAFFKRFHETNSRLAGEVAQRRARIAEIVYENGRFRELVDETRRQLDDVTQASRLDPLTGLLNRRGFEALMANRFAEGRCYALAILDLDHFKTINDTYSHLVGDEVLKHLAAILAKRCGGFHHAVRLGGEEFVLVIGADRPMAARAFCEDVRRVIEETDWSAIHAGLAVTASFGVAQNWPGSSVAEVMAAADARLYRAKTAGRNRVVWLDDVRSTPPRTAIA